ncbi:MAG TPA: hypothetical protein VND64_04205 [Pirellulales bacterium]|nr:hypothetical protein [Pirellulales bacterium]
MSQSFIHCATNQHVPQADQPHTFAPWPIPTALPVATAVIAAEPAPLFVPEPDLTRVRNRMYGRTRHRRASGWPAAIVVTLLGVAFVVYVILNKDRFTPEQAEPLTAKQPRAAANQTGRGTGKRRAPATINTSFALPTGAKDEAMEHGSVERNAQTATVATPQREAAARAALCAAREALGQRDLEAAKIQIDLATREAVTVDLRAQVARVRLLAQCVERFWAAVKETLPRLTAAEEFDIGGKVASVVDSSTETIVIRMQGTNLEYSLREIPTTLAVALAERALNKNDRHTPVVIGAFHLVDRQGDSQEARRRFAQAASLGVDVAVLIKELERRGS